MRRPTLNFVTDSMAFIPLLLLLATGVLLKFVLPPGSGGSSVWGMTRHEWGTVHFWIAVALAAVMIFHLFMHWGWIVYMVKGHNSRVQRRRVGWTLVGLLLVASVAAAPLLTPVQAGGPGGCDSHGPMEAGAEGASSNGCQSMPQEATAAAGCPSAQGAQSTPTPGSCPAEQSPSVECPSKAGSNQTP